MAPGLLPPQVPAVMEIALLEATDWDQLGISARPPNCHQVPPSAQATPTTHKGLHISFSATLLPEREPQSHRPFLPGPINPFLLQRQSQPLLGCSTDLTVSAPLCALEMQFYYGILNSHSIIGTKTTFPNSDKNIAGVLQFYLSTKS